MAAPCDFVHWPGSGSKDIAVHYLQLEPGEEFAEHIHEESIDVITLIQGKGEIISDGNRPPGRSGTVDLRSAQDPARGPQYGR